MRKYADVAEQLTLEHRYRSDNRSDNRIELTQRADRLHRGAMRGVQTIGHSGRSLRSLSTDVVEDPRSAPFHLCQPDLHPGDALFVEGLRMAQPFAHRPVMLDEIIDAFAPVPTGVVIDATLGGAGHASALLDAYPHLCLLGLDQDADAVSAASVTLERFGGRAKIANVRFDQIADAAHDAFPGQPIVGVLFDLGVSSPQLDRPERGFSYRANGPLDMRMDRRQSLTAADVVNTYGLDELTDVLLGGGEERFAKRVANAIVAARPLHDTESLAEVVRNAIPAAARRRPGDPAKRSFQAIRLEVNKELDVLETALTSALQLLVPQGRCVVLAYHSGEDRLVKHTFVDASTGGCTCPPQLPCVCGAVPTVNLLTRGSKKPSQSELSTNSRASSARLRMVEKTGGMGDQP